MLGVTAASSRRTACGVEGDTRWLREADLVGVLVSFADGVPVVGRQAPQAEGV